MKTPIYITALLAFVTCFCFGQNTSSTFLYVGSYTSGEQAAGITVFNFNTETGHLREVEKVGQLVNPSYLSIAPNGKYLYACTETKLGRNGSVSAFAIDAATGALTFINKQSTGGRNPVHLTVDQTGKQVIAGNYTDAGISVFRCNSDGSLLPYSQLIEFEGSSIIKGRQDAAHIHSCNFSPDHQYIFAPDLGADKIRVLRCDAVGHLTVVDSLTIETDKGSGPRHFTFHPNQPFAYCVEELSGTISFYTYKNGQLSLSKTYRSYESIQEEYASADVHISPDGNFLYASNRQDENSISIFGINPKNGELSLQAHQSSHGTIPRSFVIDPTGSYLLVANQTSNEVVVFSRNQQTGLLTQTSAVTGLHAPSSLKMIQFGR